MCLRHQAFYSASSCIVGHYITWRGWGTLPASANGDQYWTGNPRGQVSTSCCLHHAIVESWFLCHQPTLLAATNSPCLWLTMRFPAFILSLNFLTGPCFHPFQFPQPRKYQQSSCYWREITWLQIIIARNRHSLFHQKSVNESLWIHCLRTGPAKERRTKHRSGKKKKNIMLIRL